MALAKPVSRERQVGYSALDKPRSKEIKMEAKTRRWLRLGATGLLILLVGISVVLAVEYNTSESNAAAVSLIRDPNGDFTKQHGAAKRCLGWFKCQDSDS